MVRQFNLSPFWLNRAMLQGLAFDSKVGIDCDLLRLSLIVRLEFLA